MNHESPAIHHIRQRAAPVAVCAALSLCVLSPRGLTGGSEDSGALQQFTAGAHVLGFDQSAIHVASRDHMLRVQMVGAREVGPVAESAGATATANGTAQPLGHVYYTDAWDGVTVVHEATDQSVVKTAYRVAAGAGREAIERIRLRYNRPVRADDAGGLAISYESGEMIASAPAAWQETETGRTTVQAEYRIVGEGEAGLDVGAFDPNLPLVIDGELVWNTFLGGSGDDSGYGIAVDGSGNAYVTGYSAASWGSPLRAHTADYDAFAAKLDANGSLVWNTFLGGSGSDIGYGIAVDGSGNAYVTGSSGYIGASWGSPVRAYTAQYDGFAAKLDANGSLVWNTFLGGSGDDAGNGIAVDGSGNAYVTGYSNASWGSPVRTYSAGTDAFAAKLDGNGSLVWSSFLGGSGADFGNGIAVGGGGYAYVTGSSSTAWGSPVRAYAADYDGFAAKLDANGSVVWNTFLGGSARDMGYGIALDSSGNAYLTGFSLATWGAPVRAYAGWYDGFATKLDANGSVVWNTFLGSTSSDVGRGIALDGSGNAYVTGFSLATWGTPARAYTAGWDGFAAKLNASGSLVWNSFLGGSGLDDAAGIAVDGNGNPYVAGYSEAGWGSPVRAYTADWDGFVAKLAQNSPGPTITRIKSRRATRGSAATIIGTGFSTTKSENVVYFDTKKAQVKTATTTRLRVTIPTNSKKGKVMVYVAVKGVKSNAVQFTVK
ncbi:MAG: SBBP repeat-containing protein [Acidobacteriota bacterium]